MRWFFLASILCLCGPRIYSQALPEDNDVSRPEFNGLTYKQMTRRIFDNEQQIISLLSHSHLITESYVQSLGRKQHMGMDRDLSSEGDFVIDDKYFLAAVNLRNSYGGRPIEAPLFAKSGMSKYIRTNIAVKDNLYPVSQLSMFFVDLTRFDADTYHLTYEKEERVGDIDCLLWSVMPVSSGESGGFLGEIWIESSSARIVRIRGAFRSIFREDFGNRFEYALRGLYLSQRYFHFDSRREQIANGLWLPTETYFEEQHIVSTDNNLEFHYRGYALLWQHTQQSKVSTDLSEHLSDIENGGRGVLMRLEKDGLLGSPGAVDESLNAMIQHITSAKLPPNGIKCRILLTTPAEIFSVGNVIVVSRGLLNIVPNDSVLAMLLAREIAYISLGYSDQPSRIFRQTIFEQHDKKDFPGFGIQRPAKQGDTAYREAVALLTGTLYQNGIVDADLFLSRLKKEGRRFPELLRARFGPTTCLFGMSAPVARTGADGAAQPQMLVFRNRYSVSWNGIVVDGSSADQTSEIGVPQTTVPEGNMTHKAP